MAHQPYRVPRADFYRRESKGVTIRLMTRVISLLPALLAVVAAGCGSMGPEVRLSPDALSWKPALTALLPAIGASNVVPGGAKLPEGMIKPSGTEALAAVSAPLAESFRDRSEVKVVQLLFTTTEAGHRAETVVRQYLDARAVDPSATAKVGADTGADAILLVAILRYGPEVDEIQQLSQSARTSVGASQVNIASNASRAILYFNVQFRCALVRCADGAILWDAAVRKREKRLAVLNITQESVLRSAIDSLVDTFPYARARPEESPSSPAGK